MSVVYLVGDAQNPISAEEVTDRIEAEMRILPSGQFRVDHRIWRGTISGSLQIVSLSTQPDETFICASPADNMQDLTMTTIPSTGVPSFLHLLSNKMSALWVPRSTFQIDGGAFFELGDQSILVGEVRHSDPGNQQYRSTIVLIEKQVTDSVGDVSTVAVKLEESGVEDQALQQTWERIGIESTALPVGKELNASSKNVDSRVELLCRAIRTLA